MEISDKNLSHVELTWIDPYCYVYNRPWLRFLMGLLVIVISVFGTGLVWGLVMFERFGGDPQKRGILNQLITQMLIVDMALHWISAPVLFWRHAIGPLSNAFLSWTMVIVVRLYVMFFFLTGTEYVTIKYLSVVVLKRVLPIVDDFFAFFFFVANASAAVFTTYIQLHNPWSQRTTMRFRGMPDILLDNVLKQHFSALHVICFLVWLLFAGIRLKLASRREARPPSANAGGNNFNLNTISHNKDIIKPKTALLVIILMLIIFSSAYVVTVLDDAAFVVSTRIVFNLLPSLLKMIVIPIIVMHNNPEISSYVLDLYSVPH